MNASDFDIIYNPDGTCTFYFCGKPGVALAYDDFSPESAHWFCAECWEIFNALPMLIVVQDRRTKEMERTI